MKKYLFLLFAAALLSGSWTKIPNRSFNSNSWCISIGNTDLLSQTKNKIGDEVTIKKKSIKATQVLRARMYFCGQSADNATTTLIIKNNFNKTLGEYPKRNYGLSFEAEAPLKDFIEEFLPGQTIKIYVTINNSGEKIFDSTILLGQIKLN